MKMIFIVLFLIFCTLNYGRAIPRYGFIIDNNVNVRSKPVINSKKLFQLNKFDDVILLDSIKTEDKEFLFWYKIKTFHNKTGYVYSGLISEYDFNDKSFHYKKNYDQYIKKYKFIYSPSKLTIQNIDNKSVLLSKKIKYDIRYSSKQIQYPYMMFYATLINDDYYAVIINVETDKLEIDNINEQFCSIYNYSPDKSYIVIDHGTSASVRGFTIIDLLSKKNIYTGEYITEKEIKWISSKVAYFYIKVDAEEIGKPMLNYDAKHNSYAQKLIFTNGKVSKSNEIITVYTE